MAEFWLISAPGDTSPHKTWEELNRATSKQSNLSDNHKFNIPDLKVGTLDVLVGLSDDLGKLDTFSESVCRKITHYMGEVLEDQRDKIYESLLANGVDLVTYLTRFQWDIAKYPIKQSLKIIAEIIGKQVSQIEADLRTKSAAYNNLKGNLMTLERKATGSILTRNLGDIVNKDDFVLESDYLVTLLVVVPKIQKNEWESKYETLADMVVPRSTRDVYEDNDNILYTVTLFKKVVDEYKHHCREKKFIVREFTYNEEDILAGKTELSKLEADKKKHFGPLVRWLKVNFSECFTAWIHVKALRVFIESVLRYGLPVNFQAMLLQPQKKAQRRLREVLNQLYGHLDNAALSTVDTPMDIPGFNISGMEFYPYVYYKITLDLVDTSRR